MRRSAPPAVDAYRQRARRCWSVRRAGRVVGHVETLALAGVTFRASEASRLRCLRVGARDVHAWVTGEPVEMSRIGDAIRVGYRLAEPGFRRRDTGEIITRAAVVWLEPDGSAWALDPL